jgi:two-component system sensor histidine kinase VanS
VSRTGPRRRGLSVRLRLTLSYAGFLLVAGAAMFAVLIVVLRYVPDDNLVVADDNGFVPNRSDLLDVAVPLVAWGMATLAVIGLVGGWLLAGRMLRPLGPIDDAVRLAATGSLAHRIDLPGPDDELRRLADGFDTMLERLEGSFDEQRRFTANASHELRTPLAITKTMLEVARAGPHEPATRDLLARLDEVNDRAIATLESLLRLARADRVPLTRQTCSLDEVARTAIDRLSTDEPMRLTGSLAAASVQGDPVLLVQLVENLLRNAATHGEQGAPVAISTFVDRSGRPTLVVESSGSVLDPALVHTLAEPFVRGSGRTRGPAGSGLGLAVVSSIARSHGAVLGLAPRGGGGLVATVTFATA